MLKNILCWDVDDLANLKLNARKVKNNETEISSETRALLTKIMAPDYKVYNHFKAKFDEKLREFGATEMATELAELQAANEKKTEDCNFETKDNSKLKGKFKWWGKAELVGYQVLFVRLTISSIFIFQAPKGKDDDECTLMTMSEISFIKRIQNYMIKKYPINETVT